MVPHIHGCIVDVHDIQSQDELISDTGDEHPSCQWVLHPVQHY
jgi:hypothetical protein